MRPNLKYRGLIAICLLAVLTSSAACRKQTPAAEQATEATLPPNAEPLIPPAKP